MQLVAGVIFADVFATIAATANGILVAISQILRRNLAPSLMGNSRRNGWGVVFVGIVTIGLSLMLPGSVADTVIAATSLFGAGLGGAVLIRAMGWRCSGPSMSAAIVAGMLTG